MINNLGYLTQEWAVQGEEDEGPKAAELVLKNMLSDHGKHESVREAAESWTVRHVNQLRSEEKYEEALAAVTRTEPFVPLADDRLTLRRSVYDSWADGFAKQGKWTDAIEIYERALEKLPDDAHLKNNLKATWGQWGVSLTAAKKWKEAADVYAKAGKELSDADFEGNVGYIAQQWLADAWASGAVRRRARRPSRHCCASSKRTKGFRGQSPITLRA